MSVWQRIAPRRLLCALLAAAAGALSCLNPPPAAAGPLASHPVARPVTAPNQRQLRVFQKLWSLVRDGYVYPDYNGVDWNAKKAEMEALINGGLSDGEFYLLMRKLVESLNDQHSAFLPPYAAEEIYELYFASEESSGVGLLTAVSQGRDYLYVLQVVPGSPAERAGIRAHDHILHIGGYPAVDRDGYSQSFLFLGPAGSEVPVEARTPGGNARSMSLAREKLPQAAFVEARLLDDPAGRKIGYLLVPTFFAQDADRRARDALQQLMAQTGGKLDGLVVDLRINGGGALTALRNTIGLFARGTLGHFINRRGARAAFSAAARQVGNSHSVPLVVLIGHDTESAAEVFAGALQARGRARLVGQPSAGNIELVRSHILEDGSLAFIAEQRFVLPDGRTWEGAGLAPDVLAGGAWDTFTAESDAALQAAVNLLAEP